MAKIAVTQRRRSRKYFTETSVYTNIFRIVFSKVNQDLEKYIILIILNIFTALRNLLTGFRGLTMLDPYTKQEMKSSMLGMMLIQSKIMSLLENASLFSIIVLRIINVKEVIVRPKSILFSTDLTSYFIPSYSIRITTALTIIRISST